MPLAPDRHITPEHARFINEVEKLEPVDTGDLYPYVRQAGYHGSRDDQYALGRTNDYSIRSADDKAGPSDKTAAFDWISESARLHGDHTVMYRYGRRIRDAFTQRDPRLSGWREWLTYLDGQLIGFDFVGWYTRVPDPSHDMHHHMSKIRRYTTHWPSYASMLSILAGEPLGAWRVGQSRYQQQEEDMALDDLERAWVQDAFEYARTLARWTDQTLGPISDATASTPDSPQVNIFKQRFEALAADVAEIKARPQVQPAPIDTATLKAALLDPEVAAVLVEAARQGAEAAEDS